MRATVAPGSTSWDVDRMHTRPPPTLAEDAARAGFALVVVALAPVVFLAVLVAAMALPEPVDGAL
jgi:hypothetical protein